MESQGEMLKLLRSETEDYVRNSTKDETENETRSFHTATKTVRINSTSNRDSDTYVSRINGEINFSPFQVRGVIIKTTKISKQIRSWKHPHLKVV